MYAISDSHSIFQAVHKATYNQSAYMLHKCEGDKNLKIFHCSHSGIVIVFLFNCALTSISCQPFAALAM